MNSRNLFVIPEEVVSKQDMAEMILEVKEYAKWYSHNAIKRRFKSKRKHTTEAPVLSAGAARALREWTSKNGLDQRSLESLARDLKQSYDSAKSITITLAAPPNAGIEKQLTAWCRNNIRSNVFVSFKFNPAILGGMVLVCGSRIFDWSFRKQILENRNKFPGVLRNV